MGGVWQALAYGFAGVRPHDSGLEVEPALPATWSTLELRIQYRAVPLRLRVDPDVIIIDATAPITLLVDGHRVTCNAGETRIRRNNRGARS